MRILLLSVVVLTFSLCVAPVFASIYINEIVPNPTDDCLDCTEWLELYNDGDESVDMANWTLEDSKGKLLTVEPNCTSAGTTSISARGFLVVNAHGCNNTQFKLRNSADTVQLFDKNSTIISEVSYSDFDSSSSYDKAWARVPDGSASWVKIASTHSESNKAPEEDDSAEEDDATDDNSDENTTDSGGALASASNASAEDKAAPEASITGDVVYTSSKKKSLTKPLLLLLLGLLVIIAALQMQLLNSRKSGR